MKRQRRLPEGVDPVVRELARSARRVAEHVIDAVEAGRPADRELSRISAYTGLVHPRDSRFVSRSVFAAFRWWGWTRELLKRDLPFGLLASYLVDSGPYHVVTTDWAKRYHLQGATLEPPHANAGLEVRAEWLRVFLGGPKKKFNPLALVPAWFFKHLHNGDSLGALTTRVPAGRPPGWTGTGSWEDSALDAVRFKFKGITDWSLPQVLYALESFNGFGYRPKGVRSPYLWSFSNLYTKGRFVADHVYDPEKVSKQVGAALILKVLEERGLWP